MYAISSHCILPLSLRYAKTAKKVDMRRIKETTWKILTQASSEVARILHGVRVAQATTNMFPID